MLLTAIAACIFAQTPMPQVPTLSDAYGSIARKFHQEYEVILEPDTIAPEWWAGAPSIVRDDRGTYWLAARMRTAESPRGLRGYELRILKSRDGIDFKPVLRINRDDIPIPGFERPALLVDPTTKKFKLYGCGPFNEGPWGIFKFDDVSSPEKFDPKTAHLVIGPKAPAFDRDIVPHEYKDPYILHADGAYHCYVTGYIRRNERLFHFTSDDGETWEPVGDFRQPMMDLTGWHDFFIRPASVLPLGVGYLFAYEGSSTTWHDPVYNVATGIGWTFDLHHIIDLTPEAPLAISATPNDAFATFRYSAWLLVDEEIRVYAEVARPDKAHEIRMIRLPLQP